MKKIKNFINIFTIFISLFIGFLLVEIGMRIAKIEYPMFQTHDYHRGFSLRPNASGWWLKEGKAHVKINKQGLRDKEYKKNKDKNTFRIAVLGDSFAEARSIPIEKTFWFLMENELNFCKQNKKKIEVINFGVTEYSTAQQLLTLRHHVWDYEPDIILLAFFSGNDISDNSKILSNKNYRPFFVYKNNDLVLDNSFRTSKSYLLLKSWTGQVIVKLTDYSRIAQFLKEIYIKQHLKKQRNNRNKEIDNKENSLNEPGISYNQIYNPIQKKWKEAWLITESIIKLMNEEVKENGSKFFVATLSAPAQVHPDPSFRESFIKELDNNDLFYPDKRIKKLGKKEGFLVINLAKEMKDYAEKNKIFLHGFSNNIMGEGHWNIVGHKIASQIISKKMCKSLAR
jgi:hypothetical protein|tara:strand:- start:480 stop:1670 length:1191 start_codon:yes stop_codon:yes gene_type:complete